MEGVSPVQFFERAMLIENEIKNELIKPEKIHLVVGIEDITKKIKRVLKMIFIMLEN
jgi:hypothetical protein